MNNPNPNPFQDQESQSQDNTDNQPALDIPHVDRQRDMGSGLNAGTAPGTDSADSYQYQGEQSVGPSKRSAWWGWQWYWHRHGAISWERRWHKHRI